MSRFPGRPSVSGWRPALRIARRDALRARGRSLLVLLMIALPVLGLTVADVVARSAQLDPGEKAVRELGQTQARLQWYGYPGVEQSPDGQRALAPPGAGNPLPAPPTAAILADVQRVTGGRYRAVTEGRVAVTVATRAGRVGMDEWQVAYDDAALRGRFRPLAGRAPRSPNEVAATPATLARLGVALGGSVQLLEPRRTVQVVGEVGGPAVDRGRTIALFAPPQPRSDLFTGIYLAGGPAVTWSDVLALNKLGYVVLSRDALLHPPADADVPLYRDQGAQQRGNQVLVEAMVVVTAVVLATLEVVLLAGAAFAVGARRQARSLGLVSATGGSAMDVRRIVLAGGVVLGAAGAAVGVGLGLAGAAVLLPLAARHLAGVDPGHYDVRLPELVAIAVVGLVTGVLAAVVPARSAARQEPVAALTGRRGQVRTPRRTPVIGVVVLLAGVVAAAAGSALAVAASVRVNPAAGGRSWVVAGLIAGGALLVQVGVVVCSPAVVGLAARLGRFLPLAPRLALRDASRHRGRSAPAVAAVCAAVAGSAALCLLAASQSDAGRREYSLTWPVGTAGVVLAQPAPQDPNDPSSPLRLAVSDPEVARKAFERTLPVTSTTQVQVAFGCVTGVSCTNAQIQVPSPNQCPADAVGGGAPTAADRARLARDPRCSHRQLVTGSLPGPAVGGPDVARLMLGAITPEAARVLAAGGVVVSDSQFVDGGQVTFLRQTLGADGKPTGDPQPVTLPGAAVPGDSASALVVESPAAARLLGQRVVTGALVASLSADPKAGQEDAAREALVDADVTGSFGVERGYRAPYRLGLLALVVGAGIITLGASGIATGLAQADARADHATLAAVGAAPRLRRRLAAAQALTVAGLGTVLGIASGFVPAVALIAAVDRFRLVWPWTTLAEILVGIPLLAGLTAWLFTRSRVPLERRLAD